MKVEKDGIRTGCFMCAQVQDKATSCITSCWWLLYLTVEWAGHPRLRVVGELHNWYS